MREAQTRMRRMSANRPVIFADHAQSMSFATRSASGGGPPNARNTPWEPLSTWKLIGYVEVLRMPRAMYGMLSMYIMHIFNLQDENSRRRQLLRHCSLLHWHEGSKLSNLSVPVACMTFDRISSHLRTTSATITQDVPVVQAMVGLAMRVTY